VHAGHAIASALSISTWRLQLGATLVLALPLLLAWLGRRWRLARSITLVYVSAETCKLLYGIISLVATIGRFDDTAAGWDLLGDVIIIWITNVVVFTVWYWILDGGGVHRRHSRHPVRRDFLFPQHTQEIPGWEDWRPSFADYLFLGFCTSTTFGPTDVVTLSHRAKLLMMIQAAMSFASFAVLAARAVTAIT
jgi:hypothetical protein